MLVSADDKFLRKCEQSGFMSFVSSPAKLPAKISDTPPNIETPAHVLEEVQRLASLIKTTFDTLGRNAASGSGGTKVHFVPVAEYAPAFDAAAYRRLADVLKQLPIEQLAYLVALGWLGRSYHKADEWPGLLSNANSMTAEGFDRHQRYFVAQMGEVSRGLEKLRSAPNRFSSESLEGK